MKSVFQLAVLLIFVAIGAGVYIFWDNLTPGEQHHIVDKAKRGDMTGVGDTVRFKADAEVQRQKEKAGEKLKEAGAAVVDGVTDSIKKAAEDAAENAKKEIAKKTDEALDVKKDDAKNSDAKNAEADGPGKPKGLPKHQQ